MILFDPEPLAGLFGGKVNFTVIPIRFIFGLLSQIRLGIQWQPLQIYPIALLVAMNSVPLSLDNTSEGG